MNWQMILVGTLISLLATIGFFAILNSKWVKLKAKPKKAPTYDELKRELNAFSFVFIFTTFWLLNVSRYVNLSFLGTWSGVVYVSALSLLLTITRWVYSLLARRNPEAQQSIHES